MLPYSIAPSAVDLTSPGPIGSVTPSTGNFTALTATTAAIGGATIGSNALAVMGTSAFSDNISFAASSTKGVFFDGTGLLIRPASVGSQGLVIRRSNDGASGDLTLQNLTASGTVQGGALIVASGTITQSGAISGAATTTTGSRFIQAAANVTDTSSSGTVATNYVNRWGIPTLLASSATTYTNNYANWFEPATASTNVTITTNWAAGFNGAISATAVAVAGAAFAGSNTFAAQGANFGSASIGVGTNTGMDFNQIHNGLTLGSNITFGFSAGLANAVQSAMYSYGGAGSMQQGAADVDLNSAIVAQTLRTQGALTGGTTNQAGKDFTVIVSPGKGNQLGGAFIVQTTAAGGSGATVNTPITGLTVRVGTIVLTSYIVSALPAAATAGVGATAFVTDASTTLILGLGLAVVGGGANKVPVYSDGTSWLYG